MNKSVVIGGVALGGIILLLLLRSNNNQQTPTTFGGGGSGGFNGGIGGGGQLFPPFIDPWQHTSSPSSGGKHSLVGNTISLAPVSPGTWTPPTLPQSGDFSPGALPPWAGDAGIGY